MVCGGVVGRWHELPTPGHGLPKRPLFDYSDLYTLSLYILFDFILKQIKKVGYSPILRTQTFKNNAPLLVLYSLKKII